MKYFLHVIIYCLCTTSFAQIEVAPYQNNTKLSRENKSNLRTSRITAEGALELPFFDDFTSIYNYPDTTKWEKSNGVFINNTYPINPPNFGVATFEGLDSNGRAYTFAPNVQGSTLETYSIGDVLYSKPIDLSSFEISDNIGMSFYYQLGGLDEITFPEVSKNFILSLYFLKNDGTWELVWPNDTELDSIREKTVTEEFESKFIAINDTNFLHEDFQFQFEVYGRNTSNVDLWSIDYVYIDSNRTDANITDVSFVNTPTSLLNEYRSVPKDHFITNPTSFLSDGNFSTIKNIAIKDSLIIDPDTIYLRELSSNATLQKSPSPISDFPNTGLMYPGDQFDLPFTLDKNNVSNQLKSINEDRFILENTFKFKRLADQISKDNDTINGYTYIDQYYAYDDGSAEYIAGVGGSGNFVELAYEFETTIADTLTAIYFHFPQYAYNLEASSINVSVWSALAGIDGVTEDEVLFSFPYLITYSDSMINGFHLYDLIDPIILPAGKFYIGYQHNVDRKVYVGMDATKNTLDKVFTNIQFTGWNQDFLDYNINGSLMIRPKFGYKKDLIQAIHESPDYTSYFHLDNNSLYPNPTTNTLKFNNKIDRIEAYTTSGELIKTFQNPSNEINISDLKDGVYLFKLSNQYNSITQKIVKH